MSAFALDWLTLREAFDRQARAQAPDAAAVQAWRAQRGGAALSVMDLACGSGANLRLLAPLLGGDQRWQLIDHDPVLLAAVPEALARWAAALGLQHRVGRRAALAGPDIEIRGPGFAFELTLQRLDLARDLHQLPWDRTDLVTASALLDLVSASWLKTLVDQASAARTAVLFALSVEGRTIWTPGDPFDGDVQLLFAAHQRRDKGFGPALGEGAVPLASQLLREARYVVTQGPSDWIIDGARAAPDDGLDGPAMLAAMIDGLGAAALEQRQSVDAGAAACTEQDLIDWCRRRQASRSSTRLCVGHADLFAVPR